MSDVQRLLDWFDTGALIRPDARVANTVDLSRALASICGMPGVELSPSARTVVDAIGVVEHVVFVMADGLGMNLIERLPADAFLRTHLVLEMQSVFPSSTAPAVTSIATGCWPAEHGVPGWFTYLPDNDLIAAILPFIERFSKRPLGELGVTTDTAFPKDSWLPRFEYDTLCYNPAHLVGSVYSNYLSGGALQQPYEHLSAAVDQIAARIKSAAAPTYTYLYVPFIDAAEHDHGPYSKPVANTLDVVQRCVERLAGKTAGRARIVISADHGLTHVARRDQVEIKDGDPLLDLLRLPPSSEPRVPLFYVRAGCRERFVELLHERFPAHALLTIDEVEELRLLGPQPLAAETGRRMGDFMAISATSDAINYKPDGPMLGYHGGLLPEEIRIPLIVL